MANRAQYLSQFFLCVLAFVIPFPFFYASACIICIAVTWLLSLNGKELVYNLKSRKALWPWIGLYILTGISYFYSTNKAQSLFDLQSKLSVALLPIIVGAGMRIDRLQVERIFTSFVYGISSVAFFCVCRACKIWLDTRETRHFFYHDLVSHLDANAIYMSLYVVFSLSLLMFFSWTNYFRGKWKWLRYLMLVIQISFFILLSSRTLILLFFFILIPIYVKKLFKKQHLSNLQIGLIISILALLAVLIFSTENPIRKRYKSISENNISNAWLKDYSTVDERDFSNLTIRVLVWRLGVENIREHNLWWIGAGNGDAQDLQNQKMKEYKIRNIDNPDPNLRSTLYNVNLHNMFLQNLLMLGIPGLILFSLGIFIPFLLLRTYPDKIIFFIFNISSLLFMLQEAALQTQAGIIYYMFFISLFLSTYYSYDQKRVI